MSFVKLLYEEDTYQIRGACFSVYNSLGGGIKESIIQKALIIELRDRGLKTDCQKHIDIIYNGEKIGIYVPDIVVNNKIVIEIKAHSNPSRRKAILGLFKKL